MLSSVGLLNFLSGLGTECSSPPSSSKRSFFLYRQFPDPFLFLLWPWPALDQPLRGIFYQGSALLQVTCRPFLVTFKSRTSSLNFLDSPSFTECIFLLLCLSSLSLAPEDLGEAHPSCQCYCCRREPQGCVSGDHQANQTRGLFSSLSDMLAATPLPHGAFTKPDPDCFSVREPRLLLITELC